MYFYDRRFYVLAFPYHVSMNYLKVTKEKQGNRVKMERKPDGKPNNSIRKSVMMSRRAVPLQIIETAII